MDLNYFSRLVLSLVILLTSGCVLAPVIPGTSEPQPSATTTSQPTITVEATLTNSPVITQTATPARRRYIVLPGTPAAIQYFRDPGKSCDWMGAAGQVFGADGSPVLNLLVMIKGELGGQPVDLFTMTGLPEGDIYGPGGFEIKIASQPQPSTGSLTIQVQDLQGNALSAPVPLDTYEDCGKNLVIINFVTDDDE
jgi:hypothetical protein